METFFSPKAKICILERGGGQPPPLAKKVSTEFLENIVSKKSRNIILQLQNLSLTSPPQMYRAMYGTGYTREAIDFLRKNIGKAL